MTIKTSWIFSRGYARQGGAGDGTTLLRLLLFLALLLLSQLLERSTSWAASSSSVPEPTASQGKTTVSLATLPYSAPLGVISEIVRRDKVLERTLAAQGKSLRILSFMKGRDMIPRMKRGELDIALTGDMPVITMAAEAEIIIAGLAKLGSCGIVTNKRYATFADLRGKRIGVPEGSNAHYGLLIALETAGMTEDDLKIVFMEANELLPALIDKEIEAFSAWPPVIESALAGHQDLVLLQSFLNSSYIVLSSAFLAREPEVARLVLASYLRSLRWMNDDPSHLRLAAGWTKEMAETIQSKPFASIELIAAITKRDILVYAANPSLPEDELGEGGMMYKLVAFLNKKGKLPATATWPRIQKSMDTGLFSELLAEPGRYRLTTYDYGQAP